MSKNKVFTRWLQLARIYGLNALIGFGLGVTLVVMALSFGGKIEWGTEMKEIGIPQSEAASPSIPKGEMPVKAKDRETSNQEIQESLQRTMSDRFTILLVGMDNRPEEKFTSNTDSIIVVSLDKKNKKIVFLSIPRDTQVLYNQKKEKINALARLGEGIPSTQKYIEELIGNPIDAYVLTNFQGFKDIVDTLGGITINVEKNMVYDTGDKQDRYINLKKGLQRLNGSQALQYVRFRNDELADISRTARQQEVLKAIVYEVTTPQNLPKIPRLIPKLYQTIQTDLGASQLWSLAMILKDRENYEMISQTLPGSFSVEEGVSYWKVDPSKSKLILGQLFQGEKPPVFSSSNKKTLLPQNQNPSAPPAKSGITFEVLEGPED